MQMHESKVNTTRSNSSSSSHHKFNKNNSPDNQVTNNNSDDRLNKRNKNKNFNRDKQPDNDAKSASVMSNLSSYSLIDDDHIDDQESINVGNLIIDLESDLEKEKIEIEQASIIDNNTKSTTSSINTTSALSSSTSSSSSTSFGSNNNSKASSSTTNLESSNKTGGKSNQKSGSKHSNSSSVNSISNSATSNNGHSTTRTVFKSSADERGELKMKITRETKPAKSEHKTVASPNQKSPTSSSSNNNYLSHVNNCEYSCTTNDSISSKPTQSSSSISSTKECGTSTSVGTITEPDCLGPCEPGTSVTLEGIVWQETDGGILVVNVTWRGKTYVGALLDCTRHDWAPPRLCDSPASDIDSKTNKGVRTKRIVTRSNGIGLDEKNLLQTTGKLRNGKGRRILPSNDPASCSKKQRESSDKSSNENLAAQSEANTSLAGEISSITNSETASVPMNIDTTQASNNQQESITTSNISMDKAGPNSPMLIGCSEPNCSKKYRNMNGLLYHQAHAHGGDNDSSSTQDDNCSSSTKDKILKPTSSEPTTGGNKDAPNETSDRQSPKFNDSKESLVEKQPNGQKRERTPSPELSIKMGKVSSEPMPLSTIDNSLPIQEPSRASAVRNIEAERRHSSNSLGYGVPRGGDIGRRSPGAAPQRHLSEFQGHGSSSSTGNHHSSSSKPSSSSTKQSNNQPPPLPATTEEGMKPSGTSTGPPPAPHQANCYFNSAFLANTFNPYGLPPYFPRHMYDQIAPPIPTSNAAFLSRFMNSMRVPAPPESPSRLLSPSIPKNLPFPPFKVEPGAIPPPVPTSLANPPLPNISPMPPLGSGSPHLRMPSQVDPLLPPTSQPPFLPPGAGLNPAIGHPGAANPLGPVGGPQVPSLVDDSLAKQFPRRFN